MGNRLRIPKGYSKRDASPLRIPQEWPVPDQTRNRLNRRIEIGRRIRRRPVAGEVRSNDLPRKARSEFFEHAAMLGEPVQREDRRLDTWESSNGIHRLYCCSP
jgi:hypothetical protein